MALESSVLGQPALNSGTKLLHIAHGNWRNRIPMKVLAKSSRYPIPMVSNYAVPSCSRNFFASRYGEDDKLFDRARLRCLSRSGDHICGNKSVSKANLNFVKALVTRGIILAAAVCGVLVFGCRRVFAVEGVVNAGYGVIGQSILLLRNAWPKVLQVLWIFKEQGLILALLLGLSAFFSMAETSITTLWPWKVVYFPCPNAVHV